MVICNGNFLGKMLCYMCQLHSDMIGSSRIISSGFNMLTPNPAMLSNHEIIWYFDIWYFDKCNLSPCCLHHLATDRWCTCHPRVWEPIPMVLTRSGLLGYLSHNTCTTLFTQQTLRGTLRIGHHFLSLPFYVFLCLFVGLVVNFSFLIYIFLFFLYFYIIISTVYYWYCHTLSKVVCKA